MANAAQISEYAEIIDARTPAEYEEDHIPGAVNIPAFSNAQRAEVGAMHRTDPMRARQHGAALFAANLAQHLGSGALAQRPPQWAPLVYCARGGQRSGGMVEVLRRIGWAAEQLEGGYKAYRHWVMDALQQAAAQCQWRVIAGKTGSGKTRLLSALQAAGAQVLDLEALAAHRGSVFGAVAQPQPAQRKFETHLAAACAKFVPAQVVFVEAEGRKIGALHTPAPLLAAMRAAPVLRLQAALPARVAYLCAEYAEFVKNPAQFEASINQLRPFAAQSQLHHWRTQYKDGAVQEVVADLLENFYDIGYEKSLGKNYARSADAAVVRIDPSDAESVETAVKEVLSFV